MLNTVPSYRDQKEANFITMLDSNSAHHPRPFLIHSCTSCHVPRQKSCIRYILKLHGWVGCWCSFKFSEGKESESVVIKGFFYCYMYCSYTTKTFGISSQQNITRNGENMLFLKQKWRILSLANILLNKETNEQTRLI